MATIEHTETHILRFANNERGRVHAEVPGDDWDFFTLWMEGADNDAVGWDHVDHYAHNVHYIDTGACFGKKLSMVCLQTNEVFEQDCSNA